jgi:hypothetical protein
LIPSWSCFHCTGSESKSMKESNVLKPRAPCLPALAQEETSKSIKIIFDCEDQAGHCRKSKRPQGQIDDWCHDQIPVVPQVFILGDVGVQPSISLPPLAERLSISASWGKVRNRGCVKANAAS